VSDIRVRVRFFNILADYVGQRQCQMLVNPETTIQGLLLQLAEGRSESFRNVFLRDNTINSYLRVFLNEKLISHDQLDQTLQDGDDLMLFPAIAGG
jgi:molybdopterin converting factor small subunit